MTSSTRPPKEVYDDLIARLEKDLAWQNLRLENCREKTGTFADYLKKRIAVIGHELTKVRQERVSHYGPIEPKATVSHRTNLHSKEAGKPATRLAVSRISDKRGNGKKSRKAH